MKNKNTKGFTLIELLIVILIIGILAVAFLPTVFGAPSKARDQARIADLNRVQKVLVAGYLENGSLPSGDTCLDSAAAAGDFSDFLADLGGVLPTDPDSAQEITATGNDASVTCTGEYLYLAAPNAAYSFGLYASLENEDGNIACTETTPGAEDWTVTSSTTLSSGSEQCFGLLQSL